MSSFSTYSAKPATVKQDWYLIDATDKVLGRLATEIARRLRGKHKSVYTPHVDTGDFIVVKNSEKLHLTGKKVDEKLYYTHSGRPGGLKTRTYKTLLAQSPESPLLLAVKGMLPKNSLGRAMLSKLKIYPGNEHPHEAQQPIPLEI